MNTLALPERQDEAPRPRLADDTYVLQLGREKEGPYSKMFSHNQMCRIALCNVLWSGFGHWTARRQAIARGWLPEARPAQILRTISSQVIHTERRACGDTGCKLRPVCVCYMYEFLSH